MFYDSGGENKDGSSEYAKIEPGQKVIWLFNVEKIEPVEQEFDGRKVQKFQYAVVDPNNPGKERYWTANKITSEQVDAYLSCSKYKGLVQERTLVTISCRLDWK